MPKLSEILTQDVWFKGIIHNSGAAAIPIAVHNEGSKQHCLGTAIGWKNIPQMTLAAEIIRRLFPERECNCYYPYISEPDTSTVVHFNNHWDTVWADIAKVMREYELEQEV